MTRAPSTFAPRPTTTHSGLMASSAPLALVFALSSGTLNAANLPVPSIPPPNEGTQWAHATVGSGSATTYSVNVSGSRAYAVWQSFDVAAGNTFTVNGQTGKDWILVNRVVGVPDNAITPSMLSGTIAANGQVWLINPAGVIVSNTGVFNVGGLLLSSASNFDKTSFLQGGLSVNFTGATSAIQMSGAVNASGGVVAFLAPVVNIDGTVRETSPGVAQVADVAARDVSLVFTDTGAQLALDGVTINVGSDVPGACDNSCPTSGGITVGAGAQITAGRIILAAAGANLTSSIVVSGALTATQARADGQDIVLMVADQTSQAPNAPRAEVSGGAVQSGASETSTGGDISIDSDRINTLSTGVIDPLAAAGASLFIQDAGNVHVGSVTNSIGDVKIASVGNIDQIAARPGNIHAARDINLNIENYSGITLGDLTSGRDIAIANYSGATVSLNSATAGDDIVVRAYGDILVTGALTTQGAGASSDPTQAGVVLATNDPFYAFGVSFPLTGSSVDVRTNGSITVGGAITAAGAGSDVRLQGYGVAVGDVKAGEDILLSAFAYADGPDVIAGNLTAGRDVAVVANQGDITVASATAGDDIVMRAYGDVEVTGSLTTQGADVSTTAQPNQVGDLLAAADPLGVFGQTIALSGSSIEIGAGRAYPDGYQTYGSGTGNPPPPQNATGSITIGGAVSAVGVQSDARFSAPTSIALAGVSAGEDVLGAAGSGNSAIETFTAGDLSAGRDVAISDYYGDISLASATAGDDIVLRGGGAISISGALTTQGLDVSTTTAPQQAGDLLAADDPFYAFGASFPLTGSSIDIRADGSVMVDGPITAVGGQSDVRLQGYGVTVGDVNAGQDVLLSAYALEDGPNVIAGNLVAGRDAAVAAAEGNITVASVLAGDDIVMRANGDVTVTGVLTTQGNDVSTTAQPNQAGDLLAASDPLNVFGQTTILAGSSVDIGAGRGYPNAGAITIGGVATAVGAQSDARFSAPNSITLAGVSAGEDVIADTGSASGSTGTLIAGDLAAARDIAIRSQSGSITLVSATAGDVVVLRSPTAITVTGQIATQNTFTGSDPDQPGALLDALDPIATFGTTFALTESTIDVKAGATIDVGGAMTAIGPQSDIRLLALGGITTGDLNAGEDVALYSGGSLISGALTAGRDIAASTVTALTIGSGDAGDDIILRSATTVLVNGGLTTHGMDVSTTSAPDQAGDLLYASAPTREAGQALAFTGSTIDVVAGGGVGVGGSVSAAGALSNARFQAGGPLTLAAVTAGEDVVVTTNPAVPGGATPTLTTGALSAGRDVAVNSAAGAVLGSASAGGVIVVRAQGAVAVTGGLAASGVAAGSPGQAATLLYNGSPTSDLDMTFALVPGTVDVGATGAVTVAGAVTGGSSADARFVDGAGVSLANVGAGQDVLIDTVLNGSTGAVTTGSLTAGRDVAVRSGANATLGSAAAGGDVVLRIAGALSVTGDVSTTGTAIGSPSSAGALLAAASPFSAFGSSFALTGSSVDATAGGALTMGGSVTAVGSSSDVRLQGVAGVTTGAVDAGEDILLDSQTAIQAGALSAGRDVAAGAGEGSVSLASADAGEAIALRGLASITVTGALTTRGGEGSGAASVLSHYDAIGVNGTGVPLVGSSIDVKSTVIALGAVDAADDVLMSGATTTGGVTAGAITAGRDVAMVAGAGGLILASIAAGDDVVLRGPVQIAGDVTTAGHDISTTAVPGQAGDAFAALSPFQAFGATFPLTGSAVEISTGGSITVGGAISAAGSLSDARLVADGAISTGAVTGGEDIILSSGGPTTAGVISAGRDTALSSSGDIHLASITSGDDIVIRSGGGVTVDGGLSTQGLVETNPQQPTAVLYAAQPFVSFGQTLSLTGSAIDVGAGGSISIGGAVSAVGASSDARFQAVETISMVGVAAGQDVVLESEGAIASGALSAGRDIAVSSGHDIHLASGAAAGAIVIRGVALAVDGGLSTSGDVTGSPGQAVDALYAAAPFVAFGQTLSLTGSTIDVSVIGAIGIGSGVSATGGASDVRLQSAVTVTVGDVAAGEDVIIQGAGATTAGAVTAGRDIAVSAGGDIQLASASAGDDLVIRGEATLAVAGALSTQGLDSTAPDQAADILYAVSAMQIGDTLPLTGSTIDLYARNGVAVGGQVDAVGAMSDARFQAQGPVRLAGVSAGQDVLIGTASGEAQGPDVSAGDLVAGRDAVVGSAGGLTFGSASAGGVILLRAGDSIDVAGGLTTTGDAAGSPGPSANALYGRYPTNDLGAALALTPSTIDVATFGAITVGGPVQAAGNLSDARFVAGAGIALADVSAGRDILIDTGAGDSFGDVAVGNLTAGRDLAVRSSGDLQIDSATAADDIALRASGQIDVSGFLTTQGLDSSDPTEAGQLLYAQAPNTALGGTYTLTGSNIDLVGQQGITVAGQSTAAGAGSDARFQSAGAVDLGGVSAGRDIVIDPSEPGAGATTGVLVAGRDIAIQALSGPLTVASARAGDDIVMRSGGALTVSGTLMTTGMGSDSAGAGDQLASLDPSLAFWAAGAPPYAVSGGHDIDLRAAGLINLGGVATVNGPAGMVRIDSYGEGGTVTLAGIAIVGGNGTEQIIVAASDLDLTGSIDAPTADVLLFSRATSGVTILGGAATGLGSSFTFDNTEVALVTAKSLDLFSGVDPNRTGDIAIQDLTFTQGLQTIRAYAGTGSRIDILGVVSDPFSGGRFDIGAAGTDSNLPHFTQDGQSLVLASTWRPDVIRVAGTIGVTGTPFTDVSLAAGSIYIAPEPDTALSTNFEQASQSPASLPLYTGTDTLQVATGTLELRASNQILERDVRTTASGQGAGLELGKLIVDQLDSTGPMPTRVNLYGVINRNLNGVLPPSNPADLIGGNLPALQLVFYPAPNASVLFPQPAGAAGGGFFFNDCAFGVSCGGPVPASTAVFLLSDSLLEQDNLASQELPRIVMRNVQDVIDPYTPIEEEAVTNVGGEVGWMPATAPEICPGLETSLCDDDGGDLKTKPSQ